MKISECSGGGHPAACRLRDGSLWFATLRGVAIVDPARLPFNRVPPGVAVESVAVDDRRCAPSDLGDVAPGHSRFEFNFAGLSFVAPQKVQFRYKLDGFDKDWVSSGSRRTAYYTNLPPGRYRFRLMAANNDGVWSDGALSLPLRLRPHFYQTWWFYALLLLPLALAVYAVDRIRVRQVEAQFQAVLKERNRIAREIHDTLAQGFIAVSVQLEIVSRLLSAPGDAARTHLDQARSMVRDSVAEARRSIWNLRSQNAENNDLASRVSKLADQLTASSGVKVQFDVNGAYRPLDGRVEDELLKIEHEAIMNVVRHANATNIRVNLRFEPKKLQMIIEDDGCGFSAPADATGPNGHFGLAGMKERAQHIRAALTVRSAPGAGTTVWVEAPIRSRNEREGNE
jgi:signal transduction histidine kinase